MILIWILLFWWKFSEKREHWIINYPANIVSITRSNFDIQPISQTMDKWIVDCEWIVN